MRQCAERCPGKYTAPPPDADDQSIEPNWGDGHSQQVADANRKSIGAWSVDPVTMNGIHDGDDL